MLGTGTTFVSVAVALALLGVTAEAAERQTQRYAQAAPAPAEASSPPAAPAPATPAAPAPAAAPAVVPPASPVPAAAAPAAPAPAAAAPAAPAPAAAAPAAPAAPVRLTGLAAWSALVGNSISGMDDGKPLVEHYVADGTAKSMSGNEISRGTWALVGEAVCFKYDSDAECFRIEVIENTVTFTDAKGGGMRYDILKGNPKNL